MTDPTSPVKRPMSRRRKILLWVVGSLVGLFVLAGIFGESPEDDPPAAAEASTPAPESSPTAEAAVATTGASPALPAVTEEADESEPAPRTSEAEPEPATEEDEPEFDPAAAEAELVDYIVAANGGRTFDDMCDTEKLIEGTWWQCYYVDLEFKSESRIQVNLSIPGDVAGQAISADARRWFVNMLTGTEDFPELDAVTTFVDGLDTGTDYRN